MPFPLEAWMAANGIDAPTIHLRLPVHQRRHRYPPYAQYRHWTMEIEDWMETHRQRHQTYHRVSQA